MFGFIHPRPPDRRAVATQVARQERKTFSATELVVDLPADRVAGPAPDDAPIRFSVAYTLREYLSIVSDHLDFTLRRDTPAGRRARWAWPAAIAAGAGALAWAMGPGWVRGLSLGVAALSLLCLPPMGRLWLGVLVAPIFYAKKRRMPVCDFRIDADGIERTTAQGVLARRWDQVRAVRRYRIGYLVEFERGAVPIPFRCLTAAQQERLRALIVGRHQPLAGAAAGV